MDDRRCWTCGFASWSLTPTGKARKGVCGRCRFPPPRMPPLPPFIAERIKEAIDGSFIRSAMFWSQGIWPDDGKDCPCWTGKEEA